MVGDKCSNWIGSGDKAPALGRLLVHAAILVDSQEGLKSDGLCTIQISHKSSIPVICGRGIKKLLFEN